MQHLMPLTKARGKVTPAPGREARKNYQAIPKVLFQSNLLTSACFHKMCEGFMGNSPAPCCSINPRGTQ